MSESTEQKEQPRAFWHGPVAFVDGYAWYNQHVEVQLSDGRLAWETHPVRIGTQTEILPILKGAEPPETMPEHKKQVLESIRKEMTEDGDASNFKPEKSGAVRNRPARDFQRRKANSRQAKAGKGTAIN